MSEHPVGVCVTVIHPARNILADTVVLLLPSFPSVEREEGEKSHHHMKPLRNPGPLGYLKTVIPSLKLGYGTEIIPQSVPCCSVLTRISLPVA